MRANSTSRMMRGAWGRFRAARALKRAATTATTAAEIVAAALATDGTATSIAPVQVRSELEAFIELARKDRPMRVLEIGTSKGGTLYALAWASADGARIVSVDVQRFGTSRRWLYRRFVPNGRRVRLVHGNSQSHAVFDAIVNAFEHEPIDVLFIDGDHSFDGAKRDFELYAPLVRPGGLIAFHDIVDGQHASVGGVPDLWRALKPSLLDVEELVESPEQGGFGIGVARAGAPQDERREADRVPAEHSARLL